MYGVTKIEAGIKDHAILLIINRIQIQYQREIIMIKIEIGSQERNISDIDENWIKEQINRRHADGIPVCVRFKITEGNINIGLSTPTCSSCGSPKTPNPEEQRIANLWKKNGLYETDFTSDNVISFLKQFNKL